MFDKIMNYMLRCEIFMMGLRRTSIIGVSTALQRRGIENAIVYSKDNTIMILHKNRTVSFTKQPPAFSSWMMQDFDFVEYVYEQLDDWNWND